MILSAIRRQKPSSPMRLSPSIKIIPIPFRPLAVPSAVNLFLKFIVLVHYWQDPIYGTEKEILEKIFRDDKAKQFVIQWLQEVDLPKIRETFYDNFQRVATVEQRDHLQREIEQFLALFDEDAKKNDQSVIRWLPGGIVQVILNDSYKGEVVSVEFAKVLWKLWFGSASVVDRRQLISFLLERKG